MVLPGKPLWTTTRSRLAGLSRRQGRVGVVLLALLLGWSLSALWATTPGDREAARPVGAMTDVVLSQTVVAGLKGGGDYYPVAAAALRAGDLPPRPFVTFRLPMLSVLEALVPPVAVLVVLYLLVAAVFVAWIGRLRSAFGRSGPLALAAILLAGGCAAFLRGELIWLHEVWAGLLIAWSLALRHEDRWVEAAAISMMAMLIRETAALYVLVMAGLALRDGLRREAAGWAATLIVLALVVALHVRAVAGVVTASDPLSPGWGGWPGFGFFVRTTSASTALAFVPQWLAAVLVGLALFGWATWRSPLGLRVVATLVAFAVLIGVAAPADSSYWGLMVAPLLLVGLAFAPDGLRDLGAAAVGGRRIIVRRRVT